MDPENMRFTVSENRVRSYTGGWKVSSTGFLKFFHFSLKTLYGAFPVVDLLFPVKRSGVLTRIPKRRQCCFSINFTPQDGIKNKATRQRLRCGSRGT